MQLVANFNAEPQGFSVADYAMGGGLLLIMGTISAGALLNQVPRILKLEKNFSWRSDISDIFQTIENIGFGAFVGGFGVNLVKYTIDKAQNL